MYKYLFSIIIGIILFVCYNNINKFSIGIPVRYYLYTIYNNGSLGDIYVSQRGNIDSWEDWVDANYRKDNINDGLKRNKKDYKMHVGAFISDDPSETPTRVIQLIPSDDEYTEPEQQPFPNDQIPDDTDNYDTDDEIIGITQPTRPEAQLLEPAPMPETEPTTEIHEGIPPEECASAFTRI
jgi:hypothetical protein